ncbi:MAG: deoxyribodipyrimidine photolyase [Frankiales bacterium]|nr:deoxyribodipyrimidine photolyase [Frankiales bacterium]
MTAVMWFRRDLRLADNPALVSAARADDVVGVFVLDPALLRPSGVARRAVLYRTLRALNRQLDGRLVVRHGQPSNVLPKLCRDTGASEVFCAADFGPYGADRDELVADALQTGRTPVELHRIGSSYAVEPGTIVNGSSQPYQVYSAFYRSWHEHGWDQPHRAPTVNWRNVDGDDIPADPRLPAELVLPEVGEQAAHRAWKAFAGKGNCGLDAYADQRDRPDLDRTSRMSVHLKWGTIHPRSLLAELSAQHETYRKELAWREFYADVLFHRPDSAREYYRPDLKRLHYVTGATAAQRLRAWQEGQTGYPIVDAGMRQLRTEGWMHNRVRMIVASFLIKDLRLEWTDGARHFMNHLIDGDLASNNHGWQWVAGSGTDAAPYFRIFNPTLQGKKFDPDGDYVRRWVPELAGLSRKSVHEPWRDPNGAPADYPAPIVDHDVERKATLADYQSLR